MIGKKIHKFLIVSFGYTLIVLSPNVFSETILIKNATIYDGNTNQPYEGNVLIENISNQATETIKRTHSINKISADYMNDYKTLI